MFTQDNAPKYILEICINYLKSIQKTIIKLRL